MSNYFDSQIVTESQRLILLNKMRFPTMEELLAQVKVFRDDDNWLKQHRDAIKILLGFAICYPNMLKPALETILSIWWFIQLTPEDTQWEHITREGIYVADKDPKLAALVTDLEKRLDQLLKDHQYFADIRKKNLEKRSKTSERQLKKLVQMYISMFEAWKNDTNLKVIPEQCELALKTAQQAENVELLAELQGQLTYVYAIRLDYDLAIKYGEASLKLWQGIPDKRSNVGKFKAAFALGLLYRLIRMPAMAQKYIDIARAHADKDDSLSLGTWAYQQAAVLYEKDRFAESIEWYQSALNMFTIQPQSEINRKKSIASCLQGIALSQIWLRAFAEAEANLEHAMRLWRETNNAWQIANNVYTLGFLEGRRMKVSKALKLLEEAMRLTNNMVASAARDDLRISIEDTMSRLRRGRGGSTLHTAFA